MHGKKIVQNCHFACDIQVILFDKIIFIFKASFLELQISIEIWVIILISIIYIDRFGMIVQNTNWNKNKNHLPRSQNETDYNNVAKILTLQRLEGKCDKEL